MKPPHDGAAEHGFPDNPFNRHAWIIGDPKIGPGTWIGGSRSSTAPVV
jgi:hypothetical protein